MSSFWDNSYFFKEYSNDSWGVNEANEEEAVSGVPVNQKIKLPDLNEASAPPVYEPYYPAHQVYHDYGYGCEAIERKSEVTTQKVKAKEREVDERVRLKHKRNEYKE
ncbi:hypothetical protein Hanom_Chr12g01170701 [Helianthus anomalus]